MTFELVASLFLPAESGLQGVVVEAGRDWAFEPGGIEGSGAVVWGRGPLASGSGVGAGLRWLTARERAVAGLRRHPPGGLTVAGVRRLPPPRLEPGPVRNAARDLVRSGALVELWPGPRGRRAIDAAAEEAGATDLFSFSPGSGGSAVARIRKAGGPVEVIRFGVADSSADPVPAAEALRRLAGLNLTGVPRTTGSGQVAGLGWSTETLLSGRSPKAIGPELAGELSSFCATLPRSGGPPSAHQTQLQVLREHLPASEPALREAEKACGEAAASAPGIMGHNDLWAGNLLSSGDTLTGVVDWDAWDPSALPGTDLLHAMAMEEGRRHRLGLGGTWLRRPWASERFASVAAPYWRALDVTPSVSFLRAVGIAWWVCQTAWTLTRLPYLAVDEGWTRSNVEPVLAQLIT